MQTSRRFRGFTLIELLAVVAIIGILATLAIIGITNATRRARDSRRQSDITAVKQALLLYANDKGEFPTGGNYSDLSTALVPDYMAKLPTDPRNTSTLVYSYNGNTTDFALKAQMEYKGHKAALTGVTCSNATTVTTKGNGITEKTGTAAPCYRVSND
jgi:prepilin-type N-terminal cleavage/methylation domain-containing protein